MSVSRTGPLSAVLFDLDGTLVDTAPDMVGALNDLRGMHGLPALPYGEVRPFVTNGSRGLIGRGFDNPDEARTLALIEQFLDCYEKRVARESRLFPGMERVLDDLESAGIAWGVVTNKPTYLSEALLDCLELRRRSGTLVCGDTLSVRKPHPMPLLHAAAEIDAEADDCVYVGDAERDIQAGHAAGMVTIAAAWGYILPDDCVGRWRASFVADDAAALHWLLLGNATRAGPARD